MNSPLAAVILLGVVAFLATSTATTSLDEKVTFLQEQFLRKPVLHLNLDRWKTYVRTQPRNYTILALFTALSPHVQCQICKPAYEEFIIVANSYRYANLDTKQLYFAVVDYEEAPQVFQQMNLQTAPVFYLFTPQTQGRKKPEQLDIQRHGFDADAVAKFVHDNLEISIRVLRPPNYAAPLVVMLLVSLVLGLLYMRRNNLDFLYKRSTWGCVCLGIVFIFMSGQMWNHIRGPPFVITNPQTKETAFVHGSTQYQLVAETYIVAFMYAMVTIGFIVMNEACEGSSSEGGADGKKKRTGDKAASGSSSNPANLLTASPTTMVYVGLALVVLFFSFHVSVFRSKYHGYPYSLLFS